MASRTSLSEKGFHLQAIAAHHKDVETSLRLLFSTGSLARFAGYTPQEVTSELDDRLLEQEHLSSMSLLASLEAAFRVDYLLRVYDRKKDPLSRAFRGLYKEKSQRVSLDEDILPTWLDNTVGARQIVGDLRAAMKYRHWLAHGRYWEPKLGRKYDYGSVYALAASVLAAFPLLSN